MRKATLGPSLQMVRGSALVTPLVPGTHVICQDCWSERVADAEMITELLSRGDGAVVCQYCAQVEGRVSIASLERLAWPHWQVEIKERRNEEENMGLWVYLTHPTGWVVSLIGCGRHAGRAGFGTYRCSPIGVADEYVEVDVGLWVRTHGCANSWGAHPRLCVDVTWEDDVCRVAYGGEYSGPSQGGMTLSQIAALLDVLDSTSLDDVPHPRGADDDEE